MRKPIVVLAVPLALGPAVASTIYKCTAAGAAPAYQDRPCMPGATASELDEAAANLSIVPPASRSVPPSAKPPRPARLTGRADKRRSAHDRPRNELEVAERRHLKDGMTDAEVFARLGPPDFQAGKTGRKMRWTYLPAPGDAQTVTLVRFEDGKLVGVERSIMR